MTRLTLIHGGGESRADAPPTPGDPAVQAWMEEIDPVVRVRLSVWIARLTTGGRDRAMADLDTICAAGMRSEADLLAALVPATPASIAVAVCRVLACIGDENAAPSVSRLLGNASCARVRMQAALALGRLGGPDARAALTDALLLDDDEEVRARAARGLGTLRDHRAVPTLGSTLANTKEHAIVRSEAAEALGVIGRRSATPLLVRALRDPVAEVRAGAATALGLLGGLEVVPALRALTDDHAVADELGPVSGCATAAITDIRRRSLASG